MRRVAPPPTPTVGALLRLPILLVLLIGVLGSGAALAYTDRLVNRGVVWGAAQTPIPAAADNPMGINLFLEKEAADPANVHHILRVARDGGYHWIRQGFLWSDIEIAGKGDFTDRRDYPQPPKSAWDKYDLIVAEAAANGLTILARLDAPPQWAQLCPTEDHSAPARNSDFADFVRAVVSRYRGKIRYFQIWNEPNLRGEWTSKLNGQCVQQPNAAEYTALLKAAYEAAHAANPAVVILMAPLAQTVETGPANLSDLLYLQGMYDAGAQPYFDVASVMAYGLGQGPDDRRAEPQRINFARPLLTREIMARNGDSAKAVWASEVGWMSLPPDWTGKPGIWGNVSEATQADYLVAAFQRARAEWPWMGPMFVWHLRDPTPQAGEPQPYFGLLNADWTARPAFTALQRYAKRFPIADTGAGRADNAALTTSGPWQQTVLGGQPVYTATDPTASATFAFQGNSVDLLFVPGNAATRVQLTVDGAPPPGWPRDSTGQAVVTIPARGSTADRVQPDPAWPAPPGESALRVRVAEGLPFGPHTAGVRPASVAGRMWLVGYVVSRESPWGAAFPLGYGLLGLLGLGLGLASSRAAWTYPRLVRAVLTRPGRAGEGVWAGLAAVALALALAAYYFSPWQKGALAAFAVWWLLAVWRPDMALVITAATIPFFWVARPLVVGGFSGNIPLSESCLWATLVAWIAHRAWRAWAARRTVGPPSTPPTDVTLTGYLQLYQALQGPAPWRERLALVWRRDLFGPPALALLAVATFSLLTVANPDYIKDSLHAYRWTIVEPVLFYFLATAIRPGRRQALRLADGFVAGATLAAGLALGGAALNLPNYTLVVEGVTRVQGVFPHPDNLGLFLGRAFAFTAALALFLRPPAERLRRLFYALATVLMLPALFLSYSRGAWLAVAVAGGVLALTVGRRWALAYGGVAMLGGSALAVAALLDRLPPRITHLGSSLVRLDLWRAALHIGRAHPIFGIGLDQFLNQHQQYLIDMHIQLDADHRAEGWLSHPHDLILDWWLSLGIMGLLVGGWIAVRAGRGALVLSRRTDARTAALARAALAGLTVAAIHGLLDNAYFLGDLALTCWLFAALLQLLWKTAPDRPPSRNRVTRKLDVTTETRRHGERERVS